MICTLHDCQRDCSGPDGTQKIDTDLQLEPVPRRPQRGDLVLLGTLLAKILGLEHVAAPPGTSKHGCVELHPDVERLPVQGDELNPGGPHVVRDKVGAREAATARVRAHQMRAIMTDKVLTSRVIAEHFAEV